MTMNLRRSPTVWILRGLLLSALAALLWTNRVPGAEAEGKVGQFITIRAPITPAELSRVQRAANQVLKEQLSQGKRPTLIFQIGRLYSPRPARGGPDRGLCR
jgi:hypothetical protein